MNVLQSPIDWSSSQKSLDDMQISEKQLASKNASILAKEFMKQGGLIPPVLSCLSQQTTQTTIQSNETEEDWFLPDHDNKIELCSTS